MNLALQEWIRQELACSTIDDQVWQSEAVRARMLARASCFISSKKMPAPVEQDPEDVGLPEWILQE